MRTSLVVAMAMAMPACALDDRGDRGDDGVTVTYPGDPPPSTGNCPTGETCSTATPNGLSFVGAQPVFLNYPNGLITNINHQLAVGGHDVIDLQLAGKDLALPFTPASASQSVMAIEGTTASQVTIRSIQAGTAYLRVLDPAGALYDRENYASADVGQLLPVPVIETITAIGGGAAHADAFVFATGTRTIGIALLDAPNPTQHRLIDTSLVLAADGGTQTRWDAIQLANATAGHHAITASIGGTNPRSVDVELVDHADAITAIQSSGAVACFAATAHGAFISGLAWHFTIGGIDIGSFDTLGPNCVADIFANPTFTVTASAGGKTITITTTPN